MHEKEFAPKRLINLARAGEFRLGDMDVVPSTRELRRAGAVETLEPRVMQVLVALYRSIGTVVPRDELISSCWDGRIVGDNAIQRAISRLRDVSEGIGNGCLRLETVSKVGYRLLELEQALATEEDGPRLGPAPALMPGRALSRVSRFAANRRLAVAGFGLFVVIVGLAAVLSLSLTFFARPLPARTGEIAVAPFAFHHGDSALADLAQNSEESIKRHLTETGLAPISGKSGPAVNTKAEFEIGGSVGRDKARVFIDVWIDDRIGGVRAWSGRFERAREQTDGLDEGVGEEVAEDIEQTIDLRNSTSHALTTEQLVALLNANDAVLEMTDSERDATARLVKLAPDFAGAYALRAVALADYDETIDHFASEELAVSRDARISAARAIALDPKSAIAWFALGYRLGSEPRFEERESSLRRSLAIKPGLDIARFRYTTLLREVGRLEAARDIAYQLKNPAIPHVAFLYAMAGSWPQASHTMERIDSISPHEGAMTRWAVAVWWGDPRRIKPDIWRLGYTWGNAGVTHCFESYLHILVAANGKPLRGLPSTCASLPEDELPMDWRIRLLAREGDVDGAYAELDGATLPNSRSGTMFLFYPEMRAVRADPRFLKLTNRLGLRSYWQRTKQWPDFCKQEAPNLACAGVALIQRTEAPSSG